MNYTASQLEEITQRHREYSAAEHRKDVARGFILGVALVYAIWMLL